LYRFFPGITWDHQRFNGPDGLFFKRIDQILMERDLLLSGWEEIIMERDGNGDHVVKTPDVNRKFQVYIGDNFLPGVIRTLAIK
jgi:hypothetical protein